MIIANPEYLKKKFCEIESKEKNNISLTIEEEEILGLCTLMKIHDIHKLDNIKFAYYKFKHLYLIYSSDLSFTGTYYKPNFVVKSSKIFDSLKLGEINRQEFNQEVFKNIQNLRRKYNVEIKIEKAEISKDKIYLENVGKDWASQMLIENHTNQNLVLLSKETRNTIKKKKIEDYLKGTLSKAEEIDILKALLKSKYIHNEAIKILDKIGKSEIVYKLDEIDVHYNYGTIIHLLNRHYAQIASNEIISTSKTFHSPKINLNKLTDILLYIFKKINAKKALKGMVKPDAPIFLKYKNEHYALYLKRDHLNKSKLNINTFYQIDENTAYGKNDMSKIKKSKYIALASNLGIYKNFS